MERTTAVKKSEKKHKTKVTFELPAEVGAEQVVVVGEFNDWSLVADPLKRRKDGSFHTELSLPKGRRWRFRYLVDGWRWENDWAADDYEPNDHGSDDSVVIT
jgi:1,4-alpha-glucan branching enzyme